MNDSGSLRFPQLQMPSRVESGRRFNFLQSKVKERVTTGAWLKINLTRHLNGGNFRGTLKARILREVLAVPGESCMRRRRIHLKSIAALLGALFIVVGCAKRSEVQTTRPGIGEPGVASRPQGRLEEEKIPPSASIREIPVTPGVEGRAEWGPGSAAAEKSPLEDVFFDFRESTLREDAKQALMDNIRWLRANPRARVLIEGHCDERGTNEYNLALGERRAKMVRDFLVAGGVAADRISIISYGEERPFVLGHDESAWKWNRRAHFVVNPH